MTQKNGPKRWKRYQRDMNSQALNKWRFSQNGGEKKRKKWERKEKNKRGENLFERAKGSFLPSLIARSDSEIEQTDRVAYTV